MADLTVTPVATQIRPIQPMSLGEMVGLARGMQAYQQAEQTNPLALQLSQQQARTGQIALGVEEQKNIERQNMQTFFADPDKFQTDGRIDMDKINAAVKKVLQDPAVKKRIEDTGSLVVGNSPQEFAKELKEEYETYKQVVAKQKLTLD